MMSRLYDVIASLSVVRVLPGDLHGSVLGTRERAVRVLRVFLVAGRRELSLPHS